jgi:hypothetical protein
MYPLFKRNQHCANVPSLTNDLTCIRILEQDASALLNKNAGFGFRNVGTNIMHILIMPKIDWKREGD